MDYNEKINISKIKSFISENNLSINKFCILCGISYSTYKKIMTNKNTYSSAAHFKIAKVMGVYAHELLVE